MIDLDKLLGLEEIHGAARLRHVGFIERIVDAAIHLMHINYILILTVVEIHPFFATVRTV